MFAYFAALFSSNNRVAFQYTLTAHFERPWETLQALAFNYSLHHIARVGEMSQP